MFSKLFFTRGKSCKLVTSVWCCVVTFMSTLELVFGHVYANFTRYHLILLNNWCFYGTIHIYLFLITLQLDSVQYHTYINSKICILTKDHNQILYLVMTSKVSDYVLVMFSGFEEICQPTEYF